MDKSNEHFDSFNYNEPEKLPSPVKKFMEFLAGEVSVFFDVHEFVYIIEYFISRSKLKMAAKAVEAAEYFYPGEKEFAYLKATLLFKKGKSNAALNILNDARSFYLDDPDFYFLMANILLSQGKETEAENNYKKVIELVNEEELDYYLELISSSLAIAHKYHQAIKFLKFLPEKKMKATTLKDIAYYYHRLKDYEKSIKYYRKSLNKDPFDPDVWEALSLVYDNAGEKDKSLDAFLNFVATSVKDNTLDAYTDLSGTVEGFETSIFDMYELIDEAGEKLMEAGKYEKAILYLSHTVFIEAGSHYNKYFAEYNEKRNRLNYSKIATCLYHLNRIDEAENYYKLALDVDEIPKQEAYYGLSLVAKTKENYDDALHYINQAILEARKPVAAYLTHKADIYKKLGNENDALEFYAKAVVVSGAKTNYLEKFVDFVMNNGYVGNVLNSLAETSGETGVKVISDFIFERIKLYYLAEGKKFNSKKIKSAILNLLKNKN